MAPEQVKIIVSPLPSVTAEKNNKLKRFFSMLTCRELSIIPQVPGRYDPNDGRYYPNEKLKNDTRRRSSKFDTLADSLHGKDYQW